MGHLRKDLQRTHSLSGDLGDGLVLIVIATPLSILCHLKVEYQQTSWCKMLFQRSTFWAVCNPSHSPAHPSQPSHHRPWEALCHSAPTTSFSWFIAYCHPFPSPSPERLSAGALKAEASHLAWVRHPTESLPHPTLTPRAEECLEAEVPGATFPECSDHRQRTICNGGWEGRGGGC